MGRGEHRSCCKQKLKRGLWSPEEDEKLVNHITTHGRRCCWSSVPKLAGLQRCGKSCRLRWINYLRPDLKRGNFSTQEAMIIIDLHNTLGNKWAEIARHLPGRTDSAVKNFWNTNMKSKLLPQSNLSCHPPLAANPKDKKIHVTPSSDQYQKRLCGSNLNRIAPLQLQMVNDQDHLVHAVSSLIKHDQGIEFETDVDDLPPLPPSLVGNPSSVLDHHQADNCNSVLGKSWDTNILTMQFEPSEMNATDLIIDTTSAFETISQTNIQFLDVIP